MTILINSRTPKPPGIDPSVLLVDNFITEEQEQRILDEIDQEIQNQQFRSLGAAKACLSNTCFEGTAALSRFVKFTVRSSTALVPNSIVQFWGKFRQAAGTCPFTPAPTSTTSSPVSDSLPADGGISLSTIQ